MTRSQGRALGALMPFNPDRDDVVNTLNASSMLMLSHLASNDTRSSETAADMIGGKPTRSILRGTGGEVISLPLSRSEGRLGAGDKSLGDPCACEPA